MHPSIYKGKTATVAKESRNILQAIKCENSHGKGYWTNQLLQNFTKHFPISLLKTSQEEDYATIDNILIIRAVLSNLQPPLT